MNLKEIHKIIMDQHEALRWKTTQGAFLYPQIEDSAGIHMNVRGHGMFAVYTSNVSLTLAWGAEKEDMTADGVFASKEETMRWTNKLVQKRFPFLTGMDNKNTTTETASLMWNGAVIEEYTIMSVEGGEGQLPLPQLDHNGVWSVGAVETGVARIIHGASFTSFDEYIRKLGNVTVNAYDELNFK